MSREHEATFRGVPGTARLRPGPETGFERLFLAGAWTDTGWPATMEGAVRSGVPRRGTRCGRSERHAPRRSRMGGGGVIPTEKAPAVFGRARDLVAPAMRTAVGRLSAEMRPVAEYHFGWTDADGRPVSGNGGKGVRPALAILSAEAVGADTVIGVPGGVAVELVHNFSLIHDDVIDGDAERRHRPTVWARYGIGQAVIVGDALLALAQQILLDPAGVLELDRVAHATRRGARRAGSPTRRPR